MSTVVKLARRYAAHDKAFDSVILREPTFTDSHIDGLGPPAEWQPTRNGMAYFIYRTVIADYIRRLAIDPTFDCLTEISVADAMRLEQAVLDFFPDLAASTTSETASTG